MSVFYGTMTSKGQTTVPAEVRELLSLKPGDRIGYRIDGDTVTIVPKNRQIEDLIGILSRTQEKSTTVEEMNQSIGDYLAEDDDRIRNDWHRHERSSEDPVG